VIGDHPQDRQLIAGDRYGAAGIERRCRGLLAEVGQVLLSLEDRGLDHGERVGAARQRPDASAADRQDQGDDGAEEPEACPTAPLRRGW